MDTSVWVRNRFGESAADLQAAVMRALPEAHQDAVAAQAASGTRKRDPYGHTLKIRQHERLVQASKVIAGVTAFRPKGVPFDLLQVPSTRTVLLPWRYATDASRPRADARMRVSTFRGRLLGAEGRSGQLDLEHAGLDEAELEALLAEDQAVLEQLRTLARVVIIGYASNPQGMFDLGWGDADLLDDAGTVRWRHWETLALLSAGGGVDQAGASTHDSGGSNPNRPAAELRALRPTTAGAAPAGFSDAPLAGFEGQLLPRSPLDEQPQQENEPSPSQTGTSKDQR